tara:strand:- start:473 stop:730 length:258 start_codon:yes stop_codon:yes gene_type:complete
MTTEAEARIIEMMTEHRGTGSGRAVREVFDALLKASMGFDGEVEDGRSGPIGVLDTFNMEALRTVLSDRDATIRICHAIYYGKVE